MNAQFRLTDEAIRSALTPAPSVRAPEDLARSISVAVAATPQVSAARWMRGLRVTLALRLAVAALVLLGAIGGALIIASRPSTTKPPPSVPTFHGSPARTGVMPGPGPVAPVRIEWSMDLAGPVGTWSPVVSGGVVYEGDARGTVGAFDEATGAELWRRTLGAAVNGALTIADGLIYVGTDDGRETALDAASGQERWHLIADGPLRASTIVDGSIVYTASTAGTIYALDRSTGSVIWQAPVGGSVSRSIAFDAGLLYLGVGGATPVDAGSLQAWDVRTRARRWSRPLDPGDASTPVVDSGQVFVTTGFEGGSSHDVAAFDAAIGTPAWTWPPTTSRRSTLVIGAAAAGRLFVESTDGNLYTVDEATGASVGAPVAIASSTTPNAGLVGGVLYVTSDDRSVRAIDIATDGLLWRLPVSGVPSAPAVVDGRVIVGTSTGKLMSIAGAGSTP
jgi:outer membrane protein assembly factor BamB